MLLLVACSERSSTGTLIQPTQSSDTAELATDEHVVVLNSAGWDSERDGPAGCINDVIHHTDPQIPLYDGDDFRSALYPWFEPGVAPRTEEQLAQLLKRPLVSEKIAALGIRYVVTMNSGFHTSNAGGDVFPGPPGAVVWADVQVSLQANVWDVKEIRSVGSLDTSIAGRNMFILIPPIPILPATQHEACKDVGHRLAAYFAGGQQ